MTGVDPASLGKAVAQRLAEVRAAMDRYSAFAFSPDDEPPPPSLGPEDAEAAARELLLRGLRTLADPLNYAFARRLSEGDAGLGELAELSGLPRLSVWERLNDLVQAGLAARSLAGDRAAITAAGRTLVDLVEEAARSAAEEHRP
jgi:hypothetical protein